MIAAAQALLARLVATPPAAEGVLIRYNREELELVEAAAARLQLPPATYVAAVALAAAEHRPAVRLPRTDGTP
jgi:hypothetical protein